MLWLWQCQQQTTMLSPNTAIRHTSLNGFSLNMRRTLFTHMEVSINSVENTSYSFSPCLSLPLPIIHSLIFSPCPFFMYFLIPFRMGRVFYYCLRCVASASYDFDVVPERPIQWSNELRTFLTFFFHSSVLVFPLYSNVICLQSDLKQIGWKLKNISINF